MEKSIEIYRGGKGEIVFNVDMKKETIWATYQQIAELFGVDRTGVVRHMRNIYRMGELMKEGTCAKIVQVGKEGGREVRREIDVFNLDAIISVGYRVNSRKATDFRVWATRVLRKYIVEGVAVNEKRVRELDAEKLAGLSRSLAVVRRLVERNELGGDEARGVLEVISKYSLSFELLAQYDLGKIVFPRIGGKGEFQFSYEYCLEIIEELKKGVRGGELFGKMRDGSFEGAVRAIYQTFGGRELYGTVAEKAANLLYMVVKDHPFYDGNKRIGAFLFIMFLTKNRLNLTEAGECKISDRALTAITLMIAESRPEEKDLITAMVGKLLQSGERTAI
jgi:death-on-curing family protein